MITTISTIRECTSCKYRTAVMNDNLEERNCRKPMCSGKLEVIAREKK